MNKKFSTLLTAGLLMAGALFSSAQATDYIPVGPKAETISSGSMYYIVQQVGEDLAATFDYLMGMDKTTATPPALAGLNIASGGTDLAGAFALADGEISNYLWTVTEVKEAGKTYYTLKNVKTQNFLAVNGSFVMETVVADATQAKSNIFFSFGDGTKAYCGKSSETTFLLPKGGTNNTNSLLIASTSAIAFGDGSAKKIILYSVKTQPVAAADLNAAFGVPVSHSLLMALK